MTEHETLTTEIKAVVTRLQPHEVEALAAHLEQVGFRKTVELGELERFSFLEYGTHPLFRTTGIERRDDGFWVKYDDVRRLAAPKERWVAVTEKPANKTSWTGWLRGKSYDAPETVLYLDGRWIGPHGDVSEIIIAYQPLPPPPTNADSADIQHSGEKPPTAKDGE